MAVSYYYVDPVGGDDVGGTGAIGAPWQTVQHAFDNAVEGADGCQINIKDSGADVLAATLDFTAYKAANGASSRTQPVTLRGYTAAANDGGIGDLDGNNGNFILVDSNGASMESLNLVDLKLHNSGTVKPVALYFFSYMLNCELYDYGAGATTSQFCDIIECYFHDVSAGFVFQPGAHNRIVANIFVSDKPPLYLFAGTLVVEHNVLIYSGTSSYALFSHATHTVIRNNTIWDAGGNAGRGMLLDSTADCCYITNNLIANFSAVGANGIETQAGATSVWIDGNAFWNCTNNISSANAQPVGLVGNTTLGANPFVNAAAGDFTLTATSTARNTAWPTSYQYGATELYLDIGASQHVDPSGGGRRPRIRRHGV